ncbi:TRAP transporter small permease [Terricaulis silvestris]|uniref:TRAP transporter small permease protein n=1 Tax=Terricaulis silvestris TaxID=2686094 RepID=A0A6I6MMQ6_9CAUL|nr:TRAP transporter small permease [Terricaulis silvestris]QGZ96580.1 TRAP-type C4-dicarboxylate transport system, small permease component [Terricaulis silvestris]
MAALESAFAALARLTVFIAAASLCALVGLLAWQVFGRYVLNASPSWTEPLALTLMSVAALFGAAVAVRSESHFAFPTLVESSPKAVRGVLKVFARLIALVFGAALGGFGAFMMADSWAVPMAGAPIPEGMSYVGLAGGGALIALFALERLIFGDAPDPHHEAPAEA